MAAHLASYLPDLMHLAILALLLLVAAVCAGLGALAGARQWETAVVAGWGVATGAATVAATLARAGLPVVMAGLLAAGLLGLGLVVRSAVRPGTGAALDGGTALDRMVLDGGMAWRVLVLAAPLLAVLAPMDAAGWDDLSHWLPNLAYLCEYGHAPTLAEPSVWSDHSGYPFASALPGYAVFLVTGRLAEGSGLLWNTLMMLAACTCIARVLRDRLRDGFPGARAGAAAGVAAGVATGARVDAAVGVAVGASLDWLAAAAGLLAGGLLCPSFVAKIAFSSMTDSPTGSVLAVAGALVLEWFSAPDGTARDGTARDGTARRGAARGGAARSGTGWGGAGGDRRRVAICLGCCGVALIGLRQSNAALLGLMALAVMGVAVARRHRAGWPALVLLGGAFAAPLAVRSLWGAYAAQEMPGGAFTLLPFGAWRWAILPATLRSILVIMRQHPGLFLLIGWLGVCVARRSGGAGRAAALAVAAVAAAVAVGNVAFLAFTYLAADFSLPEAAAAASFWRYMTQVGPLVVLGLAAYARVGWVVRGWPRALTVRRMGMAGAAVALAIPVLGFRALRYDLESPLPAIRDTARMLQRRLPPDAGVLLVDTLGNGFITLGMQYQLGVAGEGGMWRRASRRRIVQLASPTGLAPEALGADPFPGGYVWIASGGPALAHAAGLPLQPGCSYLIHRDAGGAAILDARPSRPLLTPREAAAKLPAGADPACQGG